MGELRVQKSAGVKGWLTPELENRFGKHNHYTKDQIDNACESCALTATHDLLLAYVIFGSPSLFASLPSQVTAELNYADLCTQVQEALGGELAEINLLDDLELF